MEKKDNAIEIEKLNKALSEINFFELDNPMVSFYRDNINYYCQNSNNIKVLENRGFVFTKDDKSEFIVEFIPSYVSPEKVNMKLTNINGKSIKNYSISFDIDEIKVNYQSKVVDNDVTCVRIHKTNNVTKYIRTKKAYEKKNETFINSNDFSEYSRQEEVFYPELSPLYYKSVITIASENAYNVRPVVYTKGYGLLSTKEIDEAEFKNNIIKKQNKVLKKIFKDKKA